VCERYALFSLASAKMIWAVREALQIISLIVELISSKFYEALIFAYFLSRKSRNEK